jgi:hypothetical protein
VVAKDVESGGRKRQSVTAGPAATDPIAPSKDQVTRRPAVCGEERGRIDEHAVLRVVERETLRCR